MTMIDLQVAELTYQGLIPGRSQVFILLNQNVYLRR